MSIFEHFNLVEKLLALLGLLFLLSLLAKALTILPFNQKRKWWTSAGAAAILTAITLIFLQGHSLFFEEEGAVIAQVSNLKEIASGIFPSLRPDKNFFDRNFIFINTSTDPVLITLREGDAEDSSLRVITNRKKLKDLFHFINAHQDRIALAACDIVFPDTTAYDTALLPELQELQKENKLVLAYNSGIAEMNPLFYKQQLDAASFGDVTKVKDETFYFSHSLLNENGMPSLPYLMYLKLKHPGPVKKDPVISTEGSNCLFTNFITEFNFIDEKKLYHSNDNLPEPNTVKTQPDTALKASLPAVVYTLGRACSEDGQQEILDRISALNTSSKAIVFIGNIGDEYVDRHSTPHGLLYGATILLNEYYYIDKGYHIMPWYKMAAYIITLFLCFGGIFYWILSKASAEKRVKKESPGTPKNIWQASMSWIWVTSGFILEESHHLLLIAFVLLVDIFFHKLINVAALLFIFVVLGALLKFYLKPEKNPEKTSHNIPNQKK